MSGKGKRTSLPPTTSRASTRRRRPARNQKETSAAVTTRQLTGYRYSPSASIPETTPKPWYPLVVNYTSTPEEITAGYFVSYILKQLDPDSITFRPAGSESGRVGASFELRFNKVEVWNLTGKAVSLTVWEPANQYKANDPGYTYNQLGGWTDSGGDNSFPRIGYSYPFSLQQETHTLNYANANTFKLITTTASSSSDTILHRFHLHWRVPGPVQFTTVIPHSPAVQDVLKSLSDSLIATKIFEKTTQSQTDKIIDWLRTIRDKIPSECPGLSTEVDDFLASFEQLNL